MLKIFCLSILLLVLPLSACAGNKADGPSNVVKSFFKASSKNDGSQCQFLTSNYQKTKFGGTGRKCEEGTVLVRNKASDNTSKQYLDLAWKALRADAVDRNGLYAPSAKLLAAAITYSEPGLTTRIGDLEAAKSSTTEHEIFLDASKASTRHITLYSHSESGTVWALEASETSPPTLLAKAHGDSFRAVAPPTIKINHVKVQSHITTVRASFSDKTGPDQIVLYGLVRDGSRWLIDMIHYY